MLPDRTLGEKNATRERERLSSILNSMSDEELELIKLEEKALRQWQMREPTEEEINSLPTLSIEDIPANVSRPSANVDLINGVKILRCPVKTNGIVYISLFFDASDLAKEELLNLSMLSSCLLNFPTENQDALSVQNDIKANLGSLFTSFTLGTRDGITTPYLKLGASALLSKTDDLIRLIREVMLTSKIDNEGEIKNIILQAKSHIEDMMISAGEAIALSRVEAGINESGAISEYLSGYEAYKTLSALARDDEAISAITKSISALLKKLCDRQRLTIAVTGDIDVDTIREITEIFPIDECRPEKQITPLCAAESEFVLTPSRVGYAVTGGKDGAVSRHLGLMRVVRSILSYEYLWNTVRVQGGAYGTGFIPRKDGTLSFYSYRDPSPNKSLIAYKNSSDYLRKMADDGEDITKFIIGAIGEYDSIITSRVASVISANDYLNDWSTDDEHKVRSEMLKLTSDDLYTAADIIDSVLSHSNICVVGGAEHLESLDEKPIKILKI